MEPRGTLLKKIRPEIKSVNTKAQSLDIETFQNETLRPILKFQNDLLLEVYRQYIAQYKNAFYELHELQKPDYINHSLKANHTFRNLMIGTVIGLFSVEEYLYYVGQSSVINKRIISMLVQRYQDQMHLLDQRLYI
jgi:hypothetical protein